VFPANNWLTILCDDVSTWTHEQEQEYDSEGLEGELHQRKETKIM
jgi:hypothetical protein